MSNILEAGDRLWEQLQRRYPQLMLADLTYDQSHTHHTLVCVLLFGGSGMLLAGVFLGPGTYLFGVPLAIGTLVGFGAYLVREVVARVPDWRYRPWDGLLDVLVPVTWLGPWVCSALAHAVPWWTGALLFTCAAVVAYLYTFGRPKGVLMYGSDNSG